MVLVTVGVISCGSTSGTCGEDGNGFSSSSNSQYVASSSSYTDCCGGVAAVLVVAVGCGCTRPMIVAVYAIIAVMVSQWRVVTCYWHVLLNSRAMSEPIRAEVNRSVQPQTGS